MEQQFCSAHTVDIALLKQDVAHLKTTSQEVLEAVRKLEDRSLISQFLEKFLWLGVGAFITVLVHQNYIAVNTKQDYSIAKESKKDKAN